MPSLKKSTAFVLLCAALCLSFSVHAYLMRMQTPLDKLLSKGELSRILVVEISAIKESDNIPGEVGRRELSVVIHEVIFGNGTKGEKLTVTESFSWPGNLVPLKAGQRCILLFDKSSLANVIPAHNTEFGAATPPVELRALLLKEIIDELKAEKNPVRQRLLILQGRPIFGVKEIDLVTPFLDSKDEWLRRAAITTLVELTLDEKYIKPAVDDLRAFLQSHTAETVLTTYQGWDGGSTNFHPYFVLFEYYSFLHTRYRGAEIEAKARPLLPLFGVVATTIKGERRWRNMHGLGGLYQYGTVDDIPVIYADHNDPDVHVRAVCLSHAARILGLKLRYTNDTDFAAKENEWQEAVKSEIEKQKKAKGEF